jgi:hypothetical protein
MRVGRGRKEYGILIVKCLEKKSARMMVKRIAMK